MSFFRCLGGVIVVVTGLLFTGGGIANFEGAFSAMGPGMIALTSVLYLGAVALVAYFYFIWAGPAALAARTDPEYAGYTDPAETFT